MTKIECYSDRNGTYVSNLVSCDLVLLMPFLATASELAAALRLSTRTLTRLVQEGTLRPGVHFRAGGLGTVRPRRLYDVEKVDEALGKRARREIQKLP